MFSLITVVFLTLWLDYIISFWLVLFYSVAAGFLLKKSSKTNGWSKRWFVLNEKTGKVSLCTSAYVLRINDT